MLDESLRDFAEKLAARKPTPGGGAASGYTGALGIAAGSMAIAFSIKKDMSPQDKKKLSEGADLMVALRDNLLLLVKKDCDAYSAFSDAMKLPKSTKQEKEARKEALRVALSEAMDVPFSAANLCLKGLICLDSLTHSINPRLITDVGVGAQCLGAAFRSCWYNVLINLKSVKNEQEILEWKARKAKMESEALLLERRICEAVEQALE